jgi:hypothetical protein
VQYRENIYYKKNLSAKANLKDQGSYSPLSPGTRLDGSR